ncbi:hypothetical protein MMC29_008177 [Sticta canariensis]|nr:hypothetical protein [Sticta canariensis]
MPAHGDGLQEKACAREPRRGREEAFADLEGGEEVAVGGVGAAGVGRGQPFGREDAEFDERELGVDGAGDPARGKEKIDRAPQRLVRLADTTVIEDQVRILRGMRVTKVLGLVLPAGFEGCHTHDPLRQTQGLELKSEVQIGDSFARGKTEARKSDGFA